MSTVSTEERILSVLEEDAQASCAEIADRADVSKPTVRKYIDRLEEKGGSSVGYSAEVDPKKLVAVDRSRWSGWTSTRDSTWARLES